MNTAEESVFYILRILYILLPDIIQLLTNGYHLLNGILQGKRMIAWYRC